MRKVKTGLAGRIKHLSPCAEAVVWLQDWNIPQEAWDACERGDWMLWLLGKLSGPPESKSREKLVLASCGCARLVVHLAASPNVLMCIEAAERWANGTGTLKDLIKARAAAYAAADADAAYAAATAAYTAVYTAAAAADAATYAADAADAAYTARREILKKCAYVVRRFYPKVPKIKGN